MKRYFIEEVKCGVTKGGMACGPIPGHVVTSVKFFDGEKHQWVNLVEVEGTLNTFLTDIDIYEKLIEEDFEDKEFTEFINDSFISEFEGIPLEDYSDSYTRMDDENPASPLIRYLFAVMRCEWDDLESLITMGNGKYADELDIPKTDIELEMEDEEDEE